MHLLALAFVATVAAAPQPELPLNDANLEQVYASIQPTESDLRFEKIPWRTSLWQAALEANKVDKPILLWAMNGHPLGCV